MSLQLFCDNLYVLIGLHALKFIIFMRTGPDNSTYWPVHSTNRACLFYVQNQAFKIFTLRMVNIYRVIRGLAHLMQ